MRDKTDSLSRLFVFLRAIQLSEMRCFFSLLLNVFALQHTINFNQFKKIMPFSYCEISTHKKWHLDEIYEFWCCILWLCVVFCTIYEWFGSHSILAFQTSDEYLIAFLTFKRLFQRWLKTLARSHSPRINIRIWYIHAIKLVSKPLKSFILGFERAKQ